MSRSARKNNSSSNAGDTSSSTAAVNTNGATPPTARSREDALSKCNGLSPIQLQSGVKTTKRKRSTEIIIAEFILASHTSVCEDYTVAALIFGDTYEFRLQLRDMVSVERNVNGVMLPVVHNALRPVFCSRSKLLTMTRNGVNNDNTVSMANWIRRLGEVAWMLYAPAPYEESASGVQPIVATEGNTSLKEYLKRFLKAVQVGGTTNKVDNVIHEEWYLSPAELEYLDILYNYNDRA